MKVKNARSCDLDPRDSRSYYLHSFTIHITHWELKIDVSSCFRFFIGAKEQIFFCAYDRAKWDIVEVRKRGVTHLMHGLLQTFVRWKKELVTLPPQKQFILELLSDTLVEFNNTCLRQVNTSRSTLTIATEITGMQAIHKNIFKTQDLYTI